jgi:hypothetical protein
MAHPPKSAQLSLDGLPTGVTPRITANKRAYNAAYYAANRDRLLAADRACAEQRRIRYAADRDARRVYARNWYAAHREEIRARARSRYAARASELRIVAAAWRKANPDKVQTAKRKSRAKRRDRIKAYQTLPETRARTAARQAVRYANPVNRLRHLFVAARHRAKKHALEWDSQVREHVLADPPTACASCERPLDYSTGRGTTGKSRDRSPSLDRFDPSRGYVPGNVYVICVRCNLLKRDASITELEHIIAYLHRNGTSSRHSIGSRTPSPSMENQRRSPTATR